MNGYHKPVLVKEVIEGLNVTVGKKYIDATIGGGGHLGEIVKRGGRVLGIDVDRDAIEHTRGIFNLKFSIFKEGKDWKLVQGNFRDIEKIAQEHGFEKIDGILFDLGVSSHQLDTASRGFSYRFMDAPLDLRFDQNHGESAAALINRLSEEELGELFARFGEEEKAYPIARAVCRARSLMKLETVGQLADVILSQVRNKKQQNAVLSRVFQALRIAVNDEMNSLAAGLAGARSLLIPGGRLAVISFHSLEDRKVKQFLRHGWKLISKRPIVASQEEVQKNPRARSAKLRIAEK